MGLSYKPLFHLLLDKGMKGTDLTKKKLISAPTLSKLNKGEPVDGKVIIALCEHFNWKPADIMDHVINCKFLVTETVQGTRHHYCQNEGMKEINKISSTEMLVCMGTRCGKAIACDNVEKV